MNETERITETALPPFEVMYEVGREEPPEVLIELPPNPTMLDGIDKKQPPIWINVYLGRICRWLCRQK